jgi:5-methylcytosine-specific restriction endonuclease McrA
VPSARQRKILAVVATDDTYQLRDVRGERVWVGKCIFCNRALTIAASGTPLGVATLEHIWPQHHGGGDRLENLALACAGCNREKGTRHDWKHRNDPRLAEVAAALAARRKARWRDGTGTGLEAHVRWVTAAAGDDHE